MKVVQLVTYYAPIAFFGFFANLVATYGSQIAQDYARALVVYYPLCFIYIFVAFPLFAWFGGGKGAVKEMFKHIARPAITSLGTCSSVATIPTNMEEAEATGISKDVSEIVVPLGATMHMDGSCFSCILKIVFLFGVFGRPFDSIGDMALMVVVAVLSSVGMSGVPGGGYIGEFIMCSVFFPDQLAIAYPIAITIGNLVDPPATMINSSGDYVVSYVVSRFVDGKDWFQKVLASRNSLNRLFCTSRRTCLAGRSFSLSQVSCSSLRRRSSCRALTLWPKGVAARPPRAVSRSSTGRRRPTSPMQSMTWSTGTRLSMPARAMSAALTAFTAPMTFRFTQGTSTSPATGSHTRPSRFFRAMATAWPICSGAAAPQVHQGPRRHGGCRAHLRLAAAGGAGDGGPVADHRPDAGGHVQRPDDGVLLYSRPGGTGAPAPPAARRRPPPWGPPRSGACRRWTPPRTAPWR